MPRSTVVPLTQRRIKEDAMKTGSDLLRGATGREGHGDEGRDRTSVGGRAVSYAIGILCGVMLALPIWAGPTDDHAFKVLSPIVRGNLAIFPVQSGRSYDASQLLTLDEGVRSGQ